MGAPGQAPKFRGLPRCSHGNTSLTRARPSKVGPEASGPTLCGARARAPNIRIRSGGTGAGRGPKYWDRVDLLLAEVVGILSDGSSRETGPEASGSVAVLPCKHVPGLDLWFLSVDPKTYNCSLKVWPGRLSRNFSRYHATFSSYHATLGLALPPAKPTGETRNQTKLWGNVTVIRTIGGRSSPGDPDTS